MLSALSVWSLNHWITREVPIASLKVKFSNVRYFILKYKKKKNCTILAFSYKTGNTAEEAHLPSTVSLLICFSMENFYFALNIQIKINYDQITIDCHRVKQLPVTF